MVSLFYIFIGYKQRLIPTSLNFNILLTILHFLADDISLTQIQHVHFLQADSLYLFSIFPHHFETIN